MNAIDNKRFKWKKLIEQIHSKNVIPVIGHGIYRIEDKGNGGGNTGISLYEYLAQEVVQKYGKPLPSKANHKFAKAAFNFLKKNSHYYRDLSIFLKKRLKDVRLIPSNPLWKLARIKDFRIFITTAYDDFLANTIKTVRSGETKTLSYTLDQKYKSKLGYDSYEEFESAGGTVVFHILGNLRMANNPAYTESDILETVVNFQKDMGSSPGDEIDFSQILKSSSLLFIGCGYDDWLSRFFIRTLANASYEFQSRKKPRKFVGDDFKSNIKDPLQELPQFLKDHQAEVFYTCDGDDFVDILLKKLGKDRIIQPEDFPGTVFISFEGKDRNATKRLATQLRKDGIYVWIDEKGLKAGEIDSQIIKAIDRCPVFMPVISRNSQQDKTHTGEMKYHIKEWRTALDNKKRENTKVTIVPVIIDDSNWIYEGFRSDYHFKVPGGNPTGKYKKMQKQLIDIQWNIRGLIEE